jgi:hypothetical protein
MIAGIFWLIVLAILGSCAGILTAHLVHWRRVRARQAARQAPGRPGG